jgi:hypothetical protein
MQKPEENRVKKLSAHPRYRTTYLPKVEKTAANRAIRRLCARPVNDNRAQVWELAYTALCRHSGGLTILSLSAFTAIVTLAQIL